MTKTLFTIAVCCLTATLAKSQSVGPSTLNSAGGSAVVSGSTFEYAIGDVVSGTTFSSATLVVTQDVLQPAGVPTAVGNIPNALAGMEIYPSPVSSTLYIQPNTGHHGTLQYIIFDAAGKKVLSNEAVLMAGNERQSADVHLLAAGQYMLQIQWYDGTNHQSASYKLQKLQ